MRHCQVATGQRHLTNNGSFSCGLSFGIKSVTSEKVTAARKNTAFFLRLKTYSYFIRKGLNYRQIIVESVEGGGMYGHQFLYTSPIYLSTKQLD